MSESLHFFGTQKAGASSPPKNTSELLRLSSGANYRDIAALPSFVKTRYLYVMTSRLINVRLDERRLQRVRRLRAKGISISDLLRDAIDRQYEEITKQRKPRDIESMLKQLYAQYPDPVDLPPREYDVHDRRQAKEAISRMLRRKAR